MKKSEDILRLNERKLSMLQMYSEHLDCLHHVWKILWMRYAPGSGAEQMQSKQDPFRYGVPWIRKTKNPVGLPRYFQGNLCEAQKIVAIHSGHEISVEFDRPTPLQVDGETILDVTGYTARSSHCQTKRAHCGERS